MRGAPVRDDFCLAYALAGSFQQAARSERGLKHKNGVAAASFRFDELAGGATTDFFIGRPEENDALAQGRFILLQSFQREERLHDAGFHVEGAGAVGFSCGNAKGHFRERASGVHSVIVAEDEKLSGGARLLRRLACDAEVIAAMLLGEALDPRAALAPLRGYYCAAAVCGRFLEAWRFRENEGAQGGKHVRQAWC